MHSDDVGMTLKEVSRHLMTVPRAKARFAGRAGGHRETYVPASELDGALSGSREDFVSCRHLDDFVSCRHLERGKARHQSPRWKVSCPVAT